MSDYEYYELFDELDDEDKEDSYKTISPDTLIRAAILLDRETLRDKMSIVSFYVTVYECFKAQIVSDIQSVFSMPIPESVFSEEGIRYEKSKEYEKTILSMVVGEDKKGKSITGWQDRLKASMLWLKNEGAIDEKDFDAFLDIRTLRNKYVHNMAQYVFDGIDITDYEKLKTLIDLYKKIEVWFIKNIEIHRSWTSEELPDIKDDSEISSPLISVFETMAESLDLM